MQPVNGEVDRKDLELAEILHVATTDGRKLSYEVVGILEDPNDGRAYAVLMHETDVEEEGEFIVTDLAGNLVEDESVARDVLDDFLAFAQEQDEATEVKD